MRQGVLGQVATLAENPDEDVLCRKMSVEDRADNETGEGEAIAYFLHQWSGGPERGGSYPLADEMIDHATDDLASAYVAQKGFMGSSFDRPEIVPRSSHW